MKEIFYNRFFLTAFFVGFVTLSFAQGGWDLAYIPTDSIDKNLAGKEVRFDFKSSSSDTISGTVSTLKIRGLLSKKDTVNLKIDGEVKVYIEEWKYYVDHGILSDQNLKGIDDTYYIKELFVESISDSTIKVKANFYNNEKCKSQKKVLSDSKIIEIDKEMIKGVLYRRDTD